MESDPQKRALQFIEGCTDPAKLEQLLENARERKADEVADAAERKLYQVLPRADPGTFEHAVWQSIFALEGTLKQERGKTTLLARTRQKIARDGEVKTVADLVLGKAADGFYMLMEREMPELTFEQVAIDHSEKFEPKVIDAAKSRLGSYGSASRNGHASLR